MTVATSYNVNGTTLLLVFVFVFAILRISHAADVPAVYVLGSSVVDVGNNNYLSLSLARANFRHNGIDYPNGISTGRFSNGKNIADFIAKKVRLPTSPPYLSLMGTTPPITGVSFASGGSGILNRTGVNYVQYISLAQQVEYFSMVSDKLIQQLGQSGAQMHLSQSIFTIFMGNNDISAYFTAGSAVSQQYTPQQYVDLMLSTFKGLLKMLYGLGARKMVVSGVGAIGCYPAQRKTNSTGECIVETNYWSARYNEGLKIMLQDLKSELLEMNYVYFDMYGAMINLFQNAQTYGFTDIKDACCGLGNLNADAPCIPTSNYCPNRKNYVFWDLLHLTEVVGSMFVDIIYSGTLEYAVPINMRQLIDVC
ncbi:SGNH hydrolase-type esterase domain-containing protein [Artemisia annua]|uniref:SGNH hydrolase-type esterase domain-containing protein n=1 Tax=Artemisia annua TaxID=35608 RepID=A0A2U1LZ85_ARTAN|nr:SGNH hydrolase-type esterase domain-containing protein [Artemisia annua]